MHKQKFILAVIITGLIFVSSSVFAQPIFSTDIFKNPKKPEKYEEKLLPSEKTGNKKFNLIRRFLQNTTSHYNFFFNANEKLKAVIERAKISNKDDYSKLLKFYPYTLENTASQKGDLDSIIYKSTAGILLHDLRTEWVDNFYLLIGKSYFLRKDFDSAALTFQFINYNLFPRNKNNIDDDKVIGTNATENGLGTVSIADKEKRNLIQKVFTRPPSRNEALVWQVRTFIEQNELGDAAGLISILQNDPNLPKRLQDDLNEVTSYWFYAQNNYDSAAVHLEKALSNADTKQDKSRWQFLLAQMYEQVGNYDKASDYYAKAANSTSDVVMDIYAKLNSAKMMRNTDNAKELDNSISKLLSMAKKDKYEAFRDILYYSAAQLTVKKTDTIGGMELFKKSIAKNTSSSPYKDKSFLQLGHLAYAQQHYKEANDFYDSVTVISTEANVDSATVAARKETLGRLVPKIIAIAKEDSVQRIAAMPTAEREAFVKKLAKKYRKEKGLKEEDFGEVSEPIKFASKNGEPVDLFTPTGSAVGQWYFYNTSLRGKGFNDFKNRWGKRANLDNWRRKSSSSTTATPKAPSKTNNADPDAPAGVDEKQKEPIKEIDYSYDGLMGGLPLTKELVDTSNFTIAANLYDAAQIFQNELQDYAQAIRLYEDFLRRFPTNEKLADVYFGLSFCYSKLGNTAKANMYKNLVKTNFASSNAAKIIENPTASTKPNTKNPEVTAKYESIYNMFIEGNFAKAIEEKKKADSTYNNTYWNPQLLYIESVYYIKENKDSNAIAALKNISSLYPNSPLKEKANNLIEVLGRRAAIEKYLTELEVTRLPEEQLNIVDDKPIKVTSPVVTITKPIEVKSNTTVATKPLGTDTTKTTIPTVVPKPLATDSSIKKTVPTVVPKPLVTDTLKKPVVFTNKSFSLQPDMPQYVAIVLDKVDAVYINEVKNAIGRFNKESMATASIVIKRDTISSNKTILLFSTFETAEKAMKYFDKIKKAAPVELSWLQASKYSFILINDENLALLKSNKDLPAYKDLLIKAFGNKF
jgi:tetratricopeptide (TPR) repeat protein